MYPSGRAESGPFASAISACDLPCSCWEPAALDSVRTYSGTVFPRRSGGRVGCESAIVVVVVRPRSSVSPVVRMRMRCVYARQHHRLSSLLVFDDDGRGAERAQDELGGEKERKRGRNEEGLDGGRKKVGGTRRRRKGKGKRVREAEIGI